MIVQTYLTGSTSVNIAASAEKAIAEGRIAPGALLPPVRGLASQLRVSPATVAAAYRLLQERGIVFADRRRGTRVNPAPPLALPSPVPLPKGVRDLATGNPDIALLPRLPRIEPRQRVYDEDLNDPRLVRLAREQFARDGVDAENVAVVSGALDGVERVLREHLRPGDRVAVEDPAFTGILDLLASLALVALPVAIDDEGLLPDELERVLRTCSALIVTPRAQNPTGAAFTPSRARALRRVLAKHPEVLVIEDDHAGAVAGVPYVSLVSRSTERWAVVRSVSKSLGPDLRVALLASDPHTHARVEGRQSLGIRWVSHVLQDLVVALWRDKAPALAGKIYTDRREALLTALSDRGIDAHGISGLNVWIPVAEEAATVQALMQKGWAVKAGERYRIASPPAIRVTIASLEACDADLFADDLCAVIRPSRRGSGV